MREMWDWTAGAGLLLSCLALWWIYPPLALLVLGLSLLALGLWGARTWARSGRE